MKQDDIYNNIKNLSDESLILALKELKEFRDTGILKDGLCRKLAREIYEEIKVMDLSMLFTHVIPEKIYIEASDRYIREYNLNFR